MEIKGGNRLTGAKGHGKARSAAVESILSQQELSDTFAGGEPTIEAADELLRRHRLDYDVTFP
jgi:hypothetical protein